MSTQTLKKQGLFILIALIPVFYTIAVWNKLPDEVPTHFDLSGHANGYTGKAWLWVITAINLGVFLILQNISVIDPKRHGKPANSAIDKISILVLLILTALTVMCILSALHPERNIMGIASTPAIGILFGLLGNYMYTVKPNFYAGFKLPWTLSSDYNWRKTHRFAGRMWFYGGMLILISGIIFRAKTEEIIFGCIVAILVITPIAYSFMLFKKEGNKPHYYEQEQ